MSAANDDLAPIHGLYDARRAAARLGVPIKTLSAWATRQSQGSSGFEWLPEPVGTLSGRVWDAAAIDELATRGLPERKPGPKGTHSFNR